MFRATGQVGRLMVGYQVAAEIRDWYLTKGQDALNQVDWILKGRVAKVNSFWSTQTPTAIALHIESNLWWRWDRLSIGGTPTVGKTLDADMVGNFQLVQLAATLD